MRRALPLLCLVGLACSTETPATEPTTALDLTIEFDASLAVRSFSYIGDYEVGASIEPAMFDAPVFLEPPGVRRFTHRIALTDAGPLTITIDGLDADGDVLGTGRTTVTIVKDEIATASVRLGRPSECGDGMRAGIEECDDGNRVSGDGCSAACEREPDELPFVLETEVLDVRTTTSAGFVDVADAELEIPESEVWLVFVSGLLRSTDEAEVSAEAQVLVDDEVVDLFGHQMRGGDDNWAGFMTFVPVDATDGARRVRLRFRAEVGTTEVSQLRIAATRMPPGANLQVADERETLEAQGGAVDLATLSVSPNAPGEYVVLAKTSMSDLPGGETVRAWLQTPNGDRIPEDEDGTTWANPKGAWVPMFAATRMQLDGESSFSLRGASSTAGSTSGWWDVRYGGRMRVVLTSGATVTPEGYATWVRFDHESLVQAGAARADGRDIRIVHGGVELDRVVDPDRGWNRPDTTLWFPAATALGPNDQDAYEVYFGNAEAPDPLEDPNAVFDLYDTFETFDPQRWVAARGVPQIDNGTMIVGPGSLVGAGNFEVGPNYILESRARLSNPIGAIMRWLAFIGENGDRMSFYADGGDQHAQTNTNTTHFTLPEMTEFHRWAIARVSSEVAVYWQGDQAVERHQQDDLPLGPMTVGMQNTTEQHEMIYDWIRVRPFVLPEPGTTIDGVDILHGGAPSRWQHRRIVAFRADAFEDVAYVAARGSVDTTSPDFSVAATLTTEASMSAEQIVIQSVRVSGDLDAAARKVGTLRADGQTLLETSHKSERGSATFAGYHHLAGVADAVTSAGGITYENGCRSPDGVSVRCSDAVIIVLRHPAR